MPSPTAFAYHIAPDAVNACINTGIFPSTVIAQAIEESAAGSSEIAQRFKNLFGHVASGTWLGKTGQIRPGGNKWRVYDSVGDCIKAHIKILKHPRYQIAGVTTAKTPFEQVTALQSAGYDAGPDRHQYAAKLAKIITSCNLQQYDTAMELQEKLKNNGLRFRDMNFLQKTFTKLF